MLVNMSLEVLSSFTEVASGLSANKAIVHKVDVPLVILVSHLTEGVDNNTEYDVQEDNVNKHIEAHIEYDSCVEVVVSVTYNVHVVSHTTTSSHTVTQRIKETVVQCLTVDIRVAPMLVLKLAHDPDSEHENAEKHE